MDESSTKPRDLRKALLANGYRPLPLTDKGPRIKGWSRDTIDAEWLDKNGRSHKAQNTGIRCDDLIAFDIDVLDETLADEIEQLVENVCGPSDFCRVGQWPKRLLLYRADGATRRSRRTAKYGGHMVEILTGAGRQFVAYGTHPGTGKPYTWEGKQPLKSLWKALPAITAELAEDLMNDFEERLQATGLPKQSMGGLTGNAGASEYVLTADMSFEITSPFHEFMTVKEIKRRMGRRESWWCNLTGLRPESDSEAGHVFWTSGQRVLCIYDFPRDVALYEDDGTEEMLGTLGEVLPGTPEPDNDEAPWQRSFRHLMSNYVYIANDRSVRHIDSPDFAVPRINFTDRYRQIVPAAKGVGGQLLVNYWLENGAQVADFAVMRPDRGDLLFQDGVLTGFNTYREPFLPPGRGEIDTFLEYFTHLLPHESERELCLDWIANKLQHPEHRMHAMVMVAQAFGSGRNTLIKIITAMLGYVTRTSLAHMLGRSYQSQYTDWLSGSLMVFIPEAQDTTQDAMGWKERHKAYEHIKQNLETSAEKQLIVRKRVQSSAETVYASLFIATNHYNALAIERDDRRLIVLENGPAMPAKLAGRIYKWMDDARNLHQLREWLKAREVTYQPFEFPPMTEAKTRMVEAARSGIDLAFDLLFRNAPGDLVTVSQVRAYFGYLRLAEDIQFERMNDGAIASILAARGAQWLSQDPDKARLKIAGEVTRPWILRNLDKWLPVAESASAHELARLVAELEKNGSTDKNALRLENETAPPWVSSAR